MTYRNTYHNCLIESNQQQTEHSVTSLDKEGEPDKPIGQFKTLGLAIRAAKEFRGLPVAELTKPDKGKSGEPAEEQ